MRQASAGLHFSRSMPAALLGTLLVLTGLAAGDLLRLLQTTATIWHSLLLVRHHLLTILYQSDLALLRIVLLLTGAGLLLTAWLISRIQDNRRSRPLEKLSDQRRTSPRS